MEKLLQVALKKATMQKKGRMWKCCWGELHQSLFIRTDMNAIHDLKVNDFLHFKQCLKYFNYKISPEDKIPNPRTGLFSELIAMWCFHHEGNKEFYKLGDFIEYIYIYI